MCVKITHMTASTEWATLGTRVRDARLGRGLSQGELGNLVAVDRSAVNRLEAGERKVSALELLAISEALAVPMSWLVEGPSSAVASHRTPFGERATPLETQSFAADVALDQQWRQVDQLRAGGFIAPVVDLPTPASVDVTGARELALTTRGWLGLGNDPLPSMFDVAARLGLHVAVVPGDFDGASMTPEPGLGAAVLGSDREPGRRRMTAAHEIGHHVLGDEYSTEVAPSASRGEREAVIDAFAREFLLPQTAVVDAATPSRGDAGMVRQALIGVAARYRTSWRAAVKCAERAGVVSALDADRLLAMVPVRSELLAAFPSGVAEDLAPEGVSQHWAGAVLAAYRANVIGRGRAVELLRDPGLTPEDLPDVAGEVW